MCVDNTCTCVYYVYMCIYYTLYTRVFHSCLRLPTSMINVPRPSFIQAGNSQSTMDLPLRFFCFPEGIAALRSWTILLLLLLTEVIHMKTSCEAPQFHFILFRSLESAAPATRWCGPGAQGRNSWPGAFMSQSWLITIFPMTNPPKIS